MHRTNKPSLWSRAVGWAAAATGTAVRFLSLSGASLAGAALISFGLGEIYRPLTWIAAGCFALLVDRKLAADRKAP